MVENTRRVVLVTGSATGVGRATAIRFAREGFDVVVNYTRSEKEAHQTVSLVEATGAKALLVQCDVSDDAAVRNMFEKTRDKFGRLDVLVNNAATTFFIKHKDLEELTEEKWDRILDVNLKGPFFCTRAAVPLLVQSDAAAIVNVSSVAGVNGHGSSIAYAASKGALNTMTKSLARTLAPKIRVNTVCPGPIESRWLLNVMTREEFDQRMATYPLQRAAQPEEIAETIYYLAKDATLTTGQCLVVDGGQTM